MHEDELDHLEGRNILKVLFVIIVRPLRSRQRLLDYLFIDYILDYFF